MDKICIQDLAEGLSKRKGVSRADAEVFVRNVFEIIKEYLLTDQIVKVKGLGTFKLITVESRESVNVNTGERFIIDSHGKITFTPDPILRDRVNKPFADFDTVVLNDETRTEDMERIDTILPVEEPVVDPKEDTVEDSSVETPKPVAEEPVAETPVEESPVEAPEPVAEELVAETPVEESSVEAPEPVAEELVAETPVEESPVEAPEPVAEELVAETPVEESSVEAPEPVAEELVAEIPVEESPVEVPEPVAEEPLIAPLSNPVPSENGSRKISAEEEDEDGRGRGSEKWILWLLFLAAAILLCWLYLSDGKKNEIPEDAAHVEQTETSQDTIVKPVAPAEPVKSAEELAADYPQIPGGEYWIVGTKATRVLERGDDLSKLALEHYGDKRLINYIIKYNGYTAAQASNLFVGTEVKLPELVKKD